MNERDDDQRSSHFSGGQGLGMESQQVIGPDLERAFTRARASEALTRVSSRFKRTPITAVRRSVKGLKILSLSLSLPSRRVGPSESSSAFAR